MCEHGDMVRLRVPVPASLSWTGRLRWRSKPVDRCLAPIVAALNRGGVWTATSCCGHGGYPGVIILHDGRTLRIHAGEEQSCPKRYWKQDTREYACDCHPHGEERVRVPFDEMKRRAIWRAASKYGMGVEEEAFVADLLRAALGEDTE